MKIYSKSCFISGILCLASLVLYALGVLRSSGWQWVLSAVFAAKFLHIALSESEHRRQQHLKRRWKDVSGKLYGPLAALKLNLPWVITGGFFAVALVIRLGFGIVIPVWVVICYVAALTLSAFYSLGLNRSITEQIDQEIDSEPDP